MKKMITLLLVALMCLPIVGCGSADNNDSEDIVGPWITGYWAPNGIPTDYYAIWLTELTFNEDGSGSLRHGKIRDGETDFSDEITYFVWEFKEDSDIITVLGREIYLFEISEENGKTVLDDLNSERDVYYRSDEFVLPESPYDTKSEDTTDIPTVETPDVDEDMEEIKLLPDVLLSISEITTDSFGQETETIESTFSYTKNGERYEEWELYEFFYNLGIDTNEENTECKYDSNGVMIGATFYSCYDNSTMVCKLDLEYDSSGNIIKANFKNNSGQSWTNEFSYDDENRMTTASLFISYNSFPTEEYDYHINSTTRLIQYKYDDQGNLLKESYDKNSTEYIYDENGCLIKTVKLIESYGDTRLTTEIYFYDGDQISYVEVYNKDNKMTHKLVYNYGDYYFNE